MLKNLLTIYVLIISSLTLYGQNKTDVEIAESESKLIEGIIVVVNGDVITLRDISIELVIQGKINKKDIDFYNILNRIIEDKLIYEKAKEYSLITKNIDLSVEKEYESLKNLYGSEDRLKEIIYLAGFNLSTLYERLKVKKLIFQYLNSIILTSISYNIKDLDKFYRDKLGHKFYDEEYFYSNLDKIKDEYIKAKSEQYYYNYITKLKNDAWIEYDEDLLKYMEKRIQIKE